MQHYDTLSKAVEGLKKQGFTEKLTLKPDGIKAQDKDLKLAPSDFEVAETFRFEGMTNPGDASVVYAIESEKHGLKGLLVEAYGTYADPLTAEMLEKLRYKPTK